ncbi:MAG TPA: DUF1461 domain-containing protein [Campylobacterales bacterium]|nr:DUF1461 domain-containing protein [Campylobacterales bacterium]HHD80740.1 DUF1461 domain-containing protein [Campylobacterales bacterium]HHH51063.1 DUF1461 domain-containing protein [Campylobacterales bacterium]
MRIVYTLLSIIILLAILLSSFELTLLLFHSPFGSDIIYPKAHSLTWIYLLKQQYITLIDLDIFDINEKRHLLDVKRVFEQIYFIWKIISIVSLSIFILFYRKLSIIIRQTFIIGIIINILLIIISFNFLDSFSFLHQMIFPHNSWIFQPSSILIIWFPLSYFIEFFLIFILFNLIAISTLRYYSTSLSK